MPRKSKGKFKMKGHALPGINQRSETVNLSDGRSPSSAFQMNTSYKMQEAAAKMKVPLKQKTDEELLKEGTVEETPEFIKNLENINTEAGNVGETDFSEPEIEDVKEAKRLYDGIGIPGAIEEIGLLAAKLKKRREERRKNREKGEYTPTGSDKDLIDETKKNVDEMQKNLPQVNKNDLLQKHVKIQPLNVPTPNPKPGGEAGKAARILAEKKELINERRKIENFDPKTNVEHAKIQNRINELYNDPTRHPTG